MTRDDIISMAREAGIPETVIEGAFIANSDDLGRLIAAEREACAKVCDVFAVSAFDDEAGIALNIQKSIRARGQV